MCCSHRKQNITHSRCCSLLCSLWRSLVSVSLCRLCLRLVLSTCQELITYFEVNVVLSLAVWSLFLSALGPNQISSRRRCHKDEVSRWRLHEQSKSYFHVKQLLFAASLASAPDVKVWITLTGVVPVNLCDLFIAENQHSLVGFAFAVGSGVAPWRVIIQL